MALPAVWPSVTCHGVGTLIAIISQLNTLPACAPVNASMATSRLAMHDSGSGWLATPFLCNSFIHYSTPRWTPENRPVVDTKPASGPHPEQLGFTLTMRSGKFFLI